MRTQTYNIDFLAEYQYNKYNYLINVELLDSVLTSWCVFRLKNALFQLGRVFNIIKISNEEKVEELRQGDLVRVNLCQFGKLPNLDLVIHEAG